MQNPQEAFFDMVAVGNVEASGVQYGPGESFSVQGIDRARWLVTQKAAKFASSDDVASVEDGGLSPQPESAQPTVEGTHDESQGTQAAGSTRPRR